MPSVLKELEGFNTLMAGNTLDLDRHQQSDNLDIQGLLRETIQIMDQFLWSVHHFLFADFFQIPPTYGAAVQIRNQSIHGEGWSAGRCPPRFMAASCSQLSSFFLRGSAAKEVTGGDGDQCPITSLYLNSAGSGCFGCVTSSRQNSALRVQQHIATYYIASWFVGGSSTARLGHCFFFLGDHDLQHIFARWHDMLNP